MDHHKHLLEAADIVLQKLLKPGVGRQLLPTTPDRFIARRMLSGRRWRNNPPGHRGCSVRSAILIRPLLGDVGSWAWGISPRPAAYVITRLVHCQFSLCIGNKNKTTMPRIKLRSECQSCVLWERDCPFNHTSGLQCDVLVLTFEQ